MLTGPFLVGEKMQTGDLVYINERGIILKSIPPYLHPEWEHCGMV